MLDEKIFELSQERLSKADRKQALNTFIEYIETQSKHYLGYQNVQKLDYENDLKKLLNLHINNVGDPFVQGYMTTNSKVFEKNVLDYYAKLWHAKTPHDYNDPESYWGYLLTMGSTEGNLYGLWNARDYLAGKKLIIDQENNRRPRKHRQKYYSARPEKTNPNAYTPVAFFSEDTHYSIIKAMRVLQIPTFYEIGKKYYPGENPLSPTGEWTKEYIEVPSVNGKRGTGAVDIKKLQVLVEFFASKGYPILIICNYGTTFKGAYDDVENICATLLPIFKKNSLIDRKVTYDENNDTDTRNGYWIHVDGALGASYMPFIEMAYKNKKIDRIGPMFDFRIPCVNSIVMSGHKWIGSPWPCGIFMTKVKYQLFPPNSPEYIGAPDTTFAGSRNATTALILWDYLARHSYKDQIKRAVECENLAIYTEEQLKTVQNIHSEIDLWIERSYLSLSVRFRKPNDKIVQKYTLSAQTCLINDEERTQVHIYIMPLVTKEMIDELINDLKQPDAFIN